jgi:hypothetical protein
MTGDSIGRKTERIELRGDLDRHAAEALQIEIRRLAKHHGIDIVEMRWEKDGDRK